MDLSVSAAPVGRLLDGRYRIEALLARGGMATVYQAVDTRLDRKVALKVMHAELAADDDFVARFIGEARAVAQLSDSNVVNVFDQGEDDGAVYLAMEYIEGRTLRGILHERGRLGADLALEVAESVLSALAAAHRADIVHRDVKPENVLVGNDGRVKVADFGLARALSSSSNTTRGLLGTVSYISPEQALGEQATPRSDVYSAGIMLFELLTGRTPHDGPTDFVVVRSHIDSDVAPPSQSVPLPSVVDDLVLTATSRDPAGRYADAGEFLAAVRIARASLGGSVGEPDDEDAATLTELHAEPRDSAGVTLDEALAGTVLADQVDLPESAPGTYAARAGTSMSHPVSTTRVIDSAEPAPGRHVAARGGDSARSAPPRAADQPRSRRGVIMFVLVLLLAVGVATAAWWFGSGRWDSTPSLLNLTAEDAQAAAADAGFATAPGDEDFSETVEAGLVVRTEPGPGEQILNGDEIVLVISKGPERYAVPTLSGMPVDQATQTLADLTLSVRVADETHHDEIGAGAVISQDVEPGEQVRRGTEVAIVVSLGPQPVELQDFTGRPADEATTALSDAGFQVNSAEEFSDTVDAGLVISQDPADGPAFKGDEINLVVSMGAELVKVPSVIGDRLEKAESKLRDAGFDVKIVDLFPGAGRQPQVIRMEPQGAELPRGTTITIYHF